MTDEPLTPALPLAPALIEAEARTRNARERLLGTLDEVQTRLNPVTLAQDAVGTVANGLMRDGIETVRARPRTVVAAAGLAMLLMARKPLARLLWKGAKHATTKHATATVPASLKAKRAPSTTKTPAAKLPHPKKGSSK